MTYRDLQHAADVFGLPARFTLRQLKVRHRELVMRCHPDRACAVDPSRIRLVNAAYRVLREYCDSYAFSLDEEEFYRQNPDERLRVQFADVWGGI